MDVTCAHCGEPWDVDGLRHDAIEYLSPHEGDLLAPLGPVADLISFMTGVRRDVDRLLAEIRVHLPEKELTVPALFDYWWNEPAGSEDPHRQAAARVVNTAIYRAVLSRKGCPAAGCGFDHAREGQHAHRTVHEVVLGGITDDDPILFL